MKVKLTLVAAAIAAVASGFTIAPAATAAPQAPNCTSALQAPLTGTFTDAAGNPATYSVCYTLQRFTDSNGQLTAVGKVRGTATDTVTGVTQTVKANQVASPAAIDPPATCTILNLTIQPIDLNLLGLMVHTDTIHLAITAQSGPGNLLGNLLCSLAGLLDNPNASLQQIIDLLNQILGQL
jgi:hypothetical protein